MAHAWSSAIRLCKEHELDDQLLSLAQISTVHPSVMVNTAVYFEGKKDIEKAVLLYHKAGYVSKAVELAFKSEQLGALENITRDLDENANPELLAKCAKFFIENQQPDRAVDMYAKAKKFEEAIDTCSLYNVLITEELANQMSEFDNTHMEESQRKAMLVKLAEVCMQQKNYILANTKFTQAGNKDMGMRALLKSGDTKKITVYAKVCRQSDIYIMAANYLQTVDWRALDCMNDIINFYKRGKAPDLLAGFFESCAEGEIDEFHNYPAALSALKQGQMALEQGKGSADKANEMKKKIDNINKFLAAKALVDKNPEESMKKCQVLASTLTGDSMVRPGDVLGFMAEKYSSDGNNTKAYEIIQQLQRAAPNQNPSNFVSEATLDRVHKAVDKPFAAVGRRGQQQAPAGRRQADEDEEEGEEVEEAIGGFLDEVGGEEKPTTARRPPGQLPDFLSKF